MDKARQHWQILRRVPDELARRVREFMICWGGEGVMLATEDGEGYWLGEMRFWDESIQAMEPTRLDMPNLANMAHGDCHILLLTESGQIYAMGKNCNGQLGLGSDDRKTYFSPQLISIPHKFTSVRCGRWHSVALTKDGKVWAWGENSRSQVGMSNSTLSIPSPRQIPELDLHRIVAVECGGWHSLALTDLGEVYSWGRNACGQLGYGTESTKLNTYSNHHPTRISIPSLVQSMAAGDGHTLLLTQTGEVWACGENQFGQLGLPTSTKYSASLVKVSGLPPISQIASHFETHLSIAMSAERECFAWGHLNNNLVNKLVTSTHLQLPQIYSTLDSVLSSLSSSRNTPCSVRVKGLECPQRTVTQAESLTGSIPLVDRIAQMFDNPGSNPDVKFELGHQSILAHRCMLKIFSAHFDRFFSEFSINSHFSPSFPISKCCLNSSRNITSIEINQVFSITTIPIPDHCYPTFHAYLHFLYTGTLQVPTEHLADLFELAHSHLESDLSELCLVRMRSTLSPENCCLFYQLTERHSLPEFQQELVKFIADNRSQVFYTDAFQSLDADLFKKLIISIY